MADEAIDLGYTQIEIRVRAQGKLLGITVMDDLTFAKRELWAEATMRAYDHAVRTVREQLAARLAGRLWCFACGEQANDEAHCFGIGDHILPDDEASEALEPHAGREHEWDGEEIGSRCRLCGWTLQHLASPLENKIPRSKTALPLNGEASEDA